VSGGFARFVATVRTLKLIQITNRLTRRLLPTVVKPITGVRRRAVVNKWAVSITAKPIALQGRARFLNEERSIDSAAIWNDRSCGLLWLYHLHYFDGLPGAAASDPGAANRLVERWIRENPPPGGVGWDPFPISLRIGNWIKFALQGGELSSTALDSLATQTAALRSRLEFHLLGNHLLLNACALYCAGCFLDSDDAERWREEGSRLLEAQIREQVLPDGMHFELSAMYQLLVLEALLDVINVSQAFGLRAPANLKDACQAMLGALGVLTHPDGNIAQFNDAALDESPPPAALRHYAGRLGLEGPPGSPTESSWLPHAGYARICAGEAVAMIDVAEIGPSYLPAHAHADTLTFELSLGGRRVVVDTGVSTYEANAARHFERGTAAHNTIMIDGRNSSDVWHAFRVGERARILRRGFHAADTVTTVHAEHDGYRALGVVHGRTWTMRPGRLEIVDDFAGEGTHCMECAFHFHPDFRVELATGAADVFAADGNRVLHITLEAGLEWSVAYYDHHPGFGVSQRGVRLQGRGNRSTPWKMSQVFHWGET
jgi:uncharacterized heparinase superfamily protein